VVRTNNHGARRVRISMTYIAALQLRELRAA
jgi:hypothetical protein